MADPIDDSALAKASEEAFSSIARDAPKEAKFEAMRGFASAYGERALASVKDEIFVAGYAEKDIEKLESGNPGEYTRLLALAYALTLFRSEGFLAAMDLIRSGEVLRKTDAPQNLPALYFIASTAIISLAEKKAVSKRSALYMLGVMINDGDTKPMEKAIFLELAVHIDPQAICGFKDSPIPAVKAIAQARFEEMEGKVVC